MIPARKRRWFRYSLRALFAVMTIVAVWLGWNLRTVAERRSLQTREGVSCFVLDRARHFIPGEVPGGKPIPISWRLLGAQRVDIIDLNAAQFDDDELTHYRALFPEAIVERRPATENPYDALP